ncbi:MAG: tRNA (guanosine(37)-N1)-methyltransferase TrmD, partial [Fusobacteria bacterium]|nr:tRNA (guanosine(37)-N1)-methyltransferase TrmD [Fusobacteriota bacterium]
KENSYENDSFFNDRLDYAHYTRPAEYRDMKVPEVLLSGNHVEIERYRKKESLKRTIIRRPDLFEKRDMNKEEEKLIHEMEKELENKGMR